MYFPFRRRPLACQEAVQRAARALGPALPRNPTVLPEARLMPAPSVLPPPWWRLERPGRFFQVPAAFARVVRVRVC
jgi:hypothetical protein